MNKLIDFIERVNNDVDADLTSRQLMAVLGDLYVSGYLNFESYDELSDAIIDRDIICVSEYE